MLSLFQWRVLTDIDFQFPDLCFFNLYKFDKKKWKQTHNNNSQKHNWTDVYISVGVYKFLFTQFLNLVLIGSCNSKLNKTLWTYMYVLPIANGSYQFGRHDHLFWKKWIHVI